MLKRAKNFLEYLTKADKELGERIYLIKNWSPAVNYFLDYELGDFKQFILPFILLNLIFMNLIISITYDDIFLF